MLFLKNVKEMKERVAIPYELVRQGLTDYVPYEQTCEKMKG